MRVFLTGGSGLLGSHLADQLRERGDEVVALQRAGSDTSFLRRIGCVVVEGDVQDEPGRLAPLMEGCDAVVHAAALVYAGDGWPRIRAVNVDGTRHVLEAAALAGVSRAVHLSSVVVYGAARGVVDEATPTDGPISPKDLYGRSKREAEAVAREVEHERGIAVTILRPSGVYGERDRLMIPALGRLVRRPVVATLGPGTHPLPVVYAGNVAAAMTRAVDAGRAGATYDVGFDRPVTQRDLLEGVARGLGRTPRIVPIPAGLIRGAAAVLEKLGVSAPSARHLSPTRLVQQALEPNPYPSRRIREELGWDPPFEHGPALERSGRWLRESEN